MAKKVKKEKVEKPKEKTKDELFDETVAGVTCKCRIRPSYSIAHTKIDHDRYDFEIYTNSITGKIAVKVNKH